jgi:Spy/CpxP family protein refolding chaperone
MKKRILIFSAVSIVTVALAVPFAVAQHMHMRGAGYGGHAHGESSSMMLSRLERARTALGLSDQQVTDITKIVTDLKTQNEPYRTALKGGRQAIVQALLDNPNDLATAQALLDKQNAAEQQIKVNTLNAASKALNVLTPDQRGKAAAFLQQRMAKHADK